MKLLRRFGAAALLAALAFATAPATTYAIDLLVDLGGFSPLQGQGLRDSFVGKKAGLCTNVRLESLSTPATPVIPVMWTGTVTKVRSALMGTTAGADVRVRIFNRTSGGNLATALSNNMGSLTLSTGSGLGIIDLLTPSSNNSVTVGDAIHLYHDWSGDTSQTADVDATVSVCIRPATNFLSQ